jgi:hypothetical protein
MKVTGTSGNLPDRVSETERRVTIKNFVAAVELVKHDQAQCFDDLGGRLYIREPV